MKVAVQNTLTATCVVFCCASAFAGAATTAPDPPTPVASAPAISASDSTKAVEASPQRAKLLVLDTKGSDLSQDQIAALSAIAATRADKFGQVDVAAESDVRALLQVAEQKQQFGCDDDSCLSQLAGALGARYVLATRAGKLGNTFVVSVQLYDAELGAAAARDTVEAYAVDELAGKLAPVVDALCVQVLGPPHAKGGTAVAIVASTAPAPRQENLLGWGLKIGGVAAVAVSALPIALGVVPLISYNKSKADLLRLTRSDAGTVAHKTQAVKLHDDAVAARDFYNGPGRIALLSGVALATLGVAASAAGFFVPPLDEITSAAVQTAGESK